MFLIFPLVCNLMLMLCLGTYPHVILTCSYVSFQECSMIMSSVISLGQSPYSRMFHDFITCHGISQSLYIRSLLHVQRMLLASVLNT